MSFLFAPAAGRGTLPPSADGESPAEVQRKTSRPLGANPPAAVRAPRSAGAEKGAAPLGRTRLRQFECPAQSVQKRSRPLGANTPAAVRVPRSSGAEKGAAPLGRTRQRQFECPAQPVQKRIRPVRANTLMRFEHPAGSVQKNFFRKFSKKLTIHGQFSPPSGIGLKEVTQ